MHIILAQSFHKVFAVHNMFLLHNGKRVRHVIRLHIIYISSCLLFIFWPCSIKLKCTINFFTVHTGLVPMCVEGLLSEVLHPVILKVPF